MHSKIYQEKNSYKLEINIKETKCPVCNRKKLKITNDGSIICQCGYVQLNGHDYTAGKKLNTHLDFKINKIRPKNFWRISE